MAPPRGCLHCYCCHELLSSSGSPHSCPNPPACPMYWAPPVASTAGSRISHVAVNEQAAGASRHCRCACRSAGPRSPWHGHHCALQYHRVVGWGWLVVQRLVLQRKIKGSRVFPAQRACGAEHRLRVHRDRCERSRHGHYLAADRPTTRRHALDATRLLKPRGTAPALSAILPGTTQ